MFDFEKLDVYKKAKLFNKNMQELLKRINPDYITKNQLRRASFSIVLNIAEGSGRNSKADKRNFFVISRGSVFESIAILDILRDEKLIDEKEFNTLYNSGEELSKMLYSIMKRLE